MPNELLLQSNKTGFLSQTGIKPFQLDETRNTSINPNHNLPLPYILISGSYKDDDDNDILCKMLGTYLSKYNVGVISGAGKSGSMVSHGFSDSLLTGKRYDPDRIIFYLRRKEKVPKAWVDCIGTVKFFGSEPLEVRQKMISKVMLVIVIGGKSGTKQEEQLAVINNIPVIPVARTGGTAHNIWEKQKRRPKSSFGEVKPFDEETFEALNNSNIHVAVKAVISLLKTYTWFNKSTINISF